MGNASDDEAGAKAQQIFNIANSFFNGALRCIEPVPDPYLEETHTSPTAPAATCIAFASELYMKSIALALAGEYEKTHRLDKLFSNLPVNLKNRVRKAYGKSAGIPILDVGKSLVEFSNAFVDWRYLFEKDSSLRLSNVFKLALALYQVIREEFHGWIVIQSLDETIISAANIPTIDIAIQTDGVGWKKVS